MRMFFGMAWLAKCLPVGDIKAQRRIVLPCQEMVSIQLSACAAFLASIGITIENGCTPYSIFWHIAKRTSSAANYTISPNNINTHGQLQRFALLEIAELRKQGFQKKSKGR